MLGVNLGAVPGQRPGLHTNRRCVGMLGTSDREPTQTSLTTKVTVLTLVTGNFKGHIWIFGHCS